MRCPKKREWKPEQGGPWVIIELDDPKKLAWTTVVHVTDEYHVEALLAPYRDASGRLAATIRVMHMYRGTDVRVGDRVHYFSEQIDYTKR